MNPKTKKTLIERISENAVWTIRKFANDEAVKRNQPYEVVKFKGNCLLNEGINYLTTMFGTDAKTGTPWSNANAYLGVGDSATAADATQTGLQAATNKLWKAMEATFPTYGTSQKITWKSSFGSAEANYAWNEFTVVNAADDTGQNLNRKVSAQGTKTSGQTWELTLEITLS